MTLLKPTIVIFDMDGTTVRHLNPWLLGVVEWLDDSTYKFGQIFDWLFRRGAKGHLSLGLPKNVKNRQAKVLAHRALHKVRRKNVDEIVEPCPYIFPLLDYLKSQNILLGLASNGLGKGYGHDVLQVFGLEDYFSATIFREDIKKSKPHPEALLLTLQRMNITPSAQDVIWYIGDRHKDVSAASNAAKYLPCPVIPIAYALNAAVAIIDQGQNVEQIMMSYADMLQKIIALFEE